MDPDGELDSFGHSGIPKPADSIDIGHADGNTEDAWDDKSELFLAVAGHSQVVQNFMVLQLMNQSFQTNVSIFPDNVFETQLSGLLKLNRTQMLNALKEVSVHEAAHTLGLRQTPTTFGRCVWSRSFSDSRPQVSKSCIRQILY